MSEWIEMGDQRQAIEQTIKELKEKQSGLPTQLQDKPSMGSKIINWLEWLLQFIAYFDKYFLVGGKYKKPGFFKWARLISELLLIGIGLKKLKIKSK